MDADSDLLAGAEASLATTHDSVVLPALLAADPVPVAEVLRDTHYGGVRIRRPLATSQGVEPVAPAQPSSASKGLFSKDDFRRFKSGQARGPLRAAPPGLILVG